MARISKDQYYINIAKEVAQRGTCFRAKHGAVIVCNDQIVATGYVGAPRKTKDCLERGNCLRTELNIPSGQRYELCRSVHSEQNAIINATRSGASLLDGTLYLYSCKIIEGAEDELINALPCFICKKMIINSGIKTMVCMQKDGSIKKYEIENWIKDWQENDLIDDKDKYDAAYAIKNKI